MTNEQTFHAAINALAFYRAAKRCNLTEMMSIGIPTIVCGAFSVELALKAILYNEGEFCKGHHLLALMNKLPASVLNEIHDSLAQEWPDYEQQLKNCDRAFVDWRYVHEVERALNINVNFLILLSELCCKVMMERIGITSNVPIHEQI